MSTDHTDADGTTRLRALLAEPLGLVRRLLAADDLLYHGGIVAVATVVSGGFNYAYQVFMGRALGPEQFGVFGALFALFYLVNVLGRGIRFSASRFAAELQGREGALASFYRGFAIRSLLFSCLVFVVLVAASPAIATFLGLDSPDLVVVVALTAPVGLTLTANQGAFQGLQWFVPLGWYKILLAGVKLVAGVGLVVLGYGVYGAFGGVILATLVVVLVTTVHLWHRLFRTPGRATRATRTAPGGSPTRMPKLGDSTADFDYARAYRYVGPAILAGFCVTVPGTVDVIVVKHFVGGQEAGLYTAVSVLGKILVFLPLGISTALFPKVSDGHAAADAARTDGLLDRALAYSAAVAGAGALVYGLLPELLLSLLFGPQYVDAAPLLQWYGVATVAFVLAVVVLNFQLARDRTRYVYAFAAASVGEIGLLWAVGGSPIPTIQVMLLVNAALFAYGIFTVKR